MKASLLFLAMALLLVAREARADSYSWGGKSGRFEVDVFVSGFNEGAGTGGWSEVSARDFASWAKRFNAIVPAGAMVSTIRGVDDSDTTLAIREATRTKAIVMTGGPDFEDALPLVAAHFGVKVLPAATKVKIFTLQVLASRSEARAAKFASALDERGVEPSNAFFHEACHPCMGHPAHVLEGTDGWYRVVLGVYDRPSAARTALGVLKRSFKLDGFVREL